MTWVSPRQTRRNAAEDGFRALMLGLAEQPLAPGETLRVWPTYGPTHGYAFRQGDDEVSIEVKFIGVNPMVIWKAGGWARSVQSADGSRALAKLTPADLLAACRASLIAHRAALAATRARIRAAQDLQAEATARLGFAVPALEDFNHEYGPFAAAQRAFAFRALRAERYENDIRFHVEPQPLDGLTVEQVQRLKTLLDSLAAESRA